MSVRSQEDLLALWRRVMAPSYTEALEDEPSGVGLDVPAAQAAMFEAASAAVVRAFNALRALEEFGQEAEPAAGAARAAGSVQVLRATTALGELVLPAGTPLRAEQLGTLGQVIELPGVVLAEQLVLPEGERGPVSAAVVAELPGEAGNLRAGSVIGFRELGRASVLCSVVAADRLVRALAAGNEDRFSAVMRGRHVVLVGLPSGVTAPRRIVAVTGDSEITVAPELDAADVGATGVEVQVVELSDLGLEVTQPEALAGGRYATLDALARDRGTGRVLGESDEELRVRLVTLLDTVSPAALRRLCERVLGPADLEYRILETRVAGQIKGVVCGLDPLDFGGLDAVVYESGSELVGQGSVLLDLVDYRSMFIVEVEPGSEGEFGFAFGAPDVPDPPNAWGLDAAWGGRPLGWLSRCGQLHAVIEAARAAGVNWYLRRARVLIEDEEIA